MICSVKQSFEKAFGDSVGGFDDRCQLETGVASEFGVERQHFYGESDFIDDALTGTVSTGEELQITEIVEGSVAVDVVNCFVRPKFPSNFLFHNVAVLKNLDGFFTRFRTNRHSHVAVSTKSRLRDAIGVRVEHRFLMKFVSAFLVTNPAAEIEIVRTVAVDGRKCVSAIETSPSFFFELFGSQALVSPRAFATAVFRVFSPLLSIRSQMSSGENKGFFARFAGKLDSFCDLMRAAFCGQIRKIARSAAKFPLRFGLDGEWRCAVNAGSCHLSAPSVLAHVLCLNSASNATVNLNGVL